MLLTMDEDAQKARSSPLRSKRVSEEVHGATGAEHIMQISHIYLYSYMMKLYPAVTNSSAMHLMLGSQF